MKEPKILLVEDDTAGREMGLFNLRKAGYDAHGAQDGAQGLERFDSVRPDLVITDVKMPGMSGMDLLREIKKRSDDVPVIVITAYANVDLAVDAMKAGAFDFIGKPFSRDHLLLVVEKALERKRLGAEVRSLRIKASGIERPIIHRSEAMAKVLEMADRIAQTDAAVLITGESGTGKELIARRIHVRSNRAEGPFVAVNAVAMPEQLLESELFGHEKGAFTGATSSREGRFRKAEGGTLFLDEIGEMPHNLQAKLLRVLQEKIIDPVGSDKAVPVDVRVITATNRDLPEQIREGRFREDLYYRLNVIEVSIPPLRERRSDIEPLAKHFIDVHGMDRELSVSEELMEVLSRHDWPGNVRELENICQRLAILTRDGKIEAKDLPASLVAPGATPAPLERGDWPPLPEDGLSLIDLERRVIERVLALKNGNVSQAALYLGVPRHVLAYRMEKYGIAKK